MATSLPVPEVLDLLRATPSRIAEVTADLTAAQARTAPSAGEWSVVEVLAHLRSCADVWGDCIVTLLREDRPTIRAVSPTTWIDRTDYRDLTFAPSLRAFATQRASLLAVVDGLPAEGWSRTATVTGAGAPLERSVLSYAERLARHERGHVAQIARVVAAVTG